MKRVCNVNNGKTSGSALVIVLGILSVLMLMSVAFSTFMRTERGATTNLKNAHVAEQALHSALAVAIQAIDDSLAETLDGHGNAVVDSPVAVWPQPWLASCAPDDRVRNTDGYFQSRLREGTDPVPNVLCSGAAEFLTSNQIAMVRSAAVGWAPLYSGIGVSSNGLYGAEVADYGVDAGYPEKDMESIVGRYAFVALDTTGYLDPGKIGDLSNLNNALDARKESSGDDPWRFIPVDGNVKAKTPGGTEIPNPLVSSGRSKLANLLKDAKAFFSFADAKAKKDAGFNWKTPAQAEKERLAFMPPDLYAGTGVSLSPLNPEGEPKIALPYGEDGKKLKPIDPPVKDRNGDPKRYLNDLAKRIYPAMVSVFARSRKEGRVKDWENEFVDRGTSQSYNDYIKLYFGAGGLLDLYVPRAALATVGILDAVDGDAVPGKKSGEENDNSYWAMLAGMGDNNGNIEVKVWDDNHSGDSGDVLRSVKSGISGASVENPLDYPCTVGAPLMKTFYAYVTIDHAHPNIRYNEKRKPNPEKWGNSTNYNYQVEYDAVLHVGAIAADDNRDDTSGAREMDAQLVVTFDVMAATPDDETVSGGSTASGNIRNEIEYKSGDDKWTPEIEWEGFWSEDDLDRKIYINGEKEKPENGVAIFETSSGTPNRSVEAWGSFPFTIICGVKTPNLEKKPTLDDFFPLTFHEYKVTEKSQTEGGVSGGVGTATADADTDVWVPIRFKAEITVKDKNDPKSSYTVVQQVPAPCLQTEFAGLKSWWVRVDAGVYHNKDNSKVKDTVGRKGKLDGSKGDLALGWAECLAPQFGMDTTSLRTGGSGEPSEYKFWINNVLAREGFQSSELGAGKSLLFDDLLTELALGTDVEMSENLDDPMAKTMPIPGGLFQDNGSIRYAVSDWLFPSVSKLKDLDCIKKSNKLWYEWFNETDDASCADLMHSSARDSNWIISEEGGSLYQELYTHFRSGGITSVADLGSILIGPYETLSLFKMWRPSYGGTEQESDFHPVFDYFTMDEDRYPSPEVMLRYSDFHSKNNGVMDWDLLSTRSSRQSPKQKDILFYKDSVKQRHLFSAVQNGRVNLNLPRLLEPFLETGNNQRTVRVRCADEFNPYPLAAALYGAPYPSETGETKFVTPEAAVAIASAYAKMLHDVAENKAKNKSSTVTNTVELASSDWMPAVRDVSFFASGGEDENPVLQAFLDNLKDKTLACDDMREGFLRGVSEAFTTRGQSFLLVLRADAYTARFGRQADPTDGTSLASSYALVELFRDPEPARLPDGTFPLDADGNPVLYHNWFIRSFRLF